MHLRISLFVLVSHTGLIYDPDMNTVFSSKEKNSSASRTALTVSSKTKFRQWISTDVKGIIHLLFDSSLEAVMLTTHDGSTVICLAYKAVFVLQTMTYQYVDYFFCKPWYI